MTRTLTASRSPLPEKDKPASTGGGRRAAGSANNKDLLPPKDELLAEFDGGTIPRSATWHTLITGLYYNFDGVNGMAAMYEAMEALTEHNQTLVKQVETHKGEIEIWYGQVDTWQQETQASANQAKLSAMESFSSAGTARASQVQAKAEADRAKTIVDNFNPEEMVDELIRQPLSICINYATPVQGNFIFFQSQLPVESIFPAGVPHSSAFCTTAPAAIYVMNFLKNDELVGWASFQPEATTGVFNWVNEVTFMPGDVLKVQSQIGNEDAISGLSVLLHGLRRFS